MKQIIKKAKIVTIFILALVFLGCNEDDDVNTMSLEAHFTHTINQETGKVTFINTSTGATSYSWDFGDETDSNLINPMNIYEDGTYTVTLTVYDEQGNSDTYTDVIVIGNSVDNGTGTGNDTCTSETIESLSAADLNITFMSDPTASIINDNATFEYVENPNPDSTVNNSCYVGKITKAGQNPWDNNQIDLDAKLDFNANAGLKMKVFSAVAGFTVRVKLEEIGNSGNATELEVTTTQTNAWEELTFPFASSESNQYDKIVLFFNFGVDTNTYYFDDLKLYAAGNTTGSGSSDPYTLDQAIDFEADGYGGQWTWNVFENDDNPPLEFVSNPSSSGINTSSTVAKITARQAGEPWVGTETAHGEMGITWDLSSSNAIIKIMVYKTVISDVGIKLVNPAGGAQEEIKVSNTVVNQWEELTFDFTSRIGNGLDGSTNIDQIVVFPDFDLNGRTADNIVYFDNITFN